MHPEPSPRRIRWLGTLAIAVGLAAIPLLGRALDETCYDPGAAAVGASTFKTYCATCHGATGHGDGPVSAQLRFAPFDLTSIARRNRGSYPFDKVYKIIDGRAPVKGHGGTDMPVWGDAFRESPEGYDPGRVKEKITQLVHFLASIQEAAGK